MNYLIIGLGKSGIGAIKLLLTKNENVFVYDDNKKVVNQMINAKIFSQKVTFLQKINAKTLKFVDYVVISPGVSAQKYEKLANKCGVKIIGEIELAYRFCDCPVLAVTGTNGKTTTVNLLFEMLKKVEPTTCLVGNVGNSFCETLAEKNVCPAVCEVSSFQLETIDSFKPNMVGFLNIRDDHLDRYKTFDNYFRAKQNIFKNFSKFNIFVLNYDDKNLLEFSNSVDCEKYYFSLSKIPEELFGAYVFEDEIKFKLHQETYAIKLKEIPLLGKHNLYNFMCAGLMALLYGVGFDVVRCAVKEFSLPEHRVEFVKKIDGVSFYDDSKGTNIHATLCAILCFRESTLLMLGGQDKGENFDNLFGNLPKNVTRIFVFGKTRKKILKSAKKSGYQNIYDFKSLSDAFKQINTKEMEEKVVLLSPACSSFDQFSSYEERGNYFKSLVEGCLSEKSIY